LGDRAGQAMSPKLRTQVTRCCTFQRSIATDHMKWRPLLYRSSSCQPRQAIAPAQYSNLKCVSRLRATLYIKVKLTLILLTWRIWWAPNNASKWQMGFNSSFKWLIHLVRNCVEIYSQTTWTPQFVSPCSAILLPSSLQNQTFLCLCNPKIFLLCSRNSLLGKDYRNPTRYSAQDAFMKIKAERSLCKVNVIKRLGYKEIRSLIGWQFVQWKQSTGKEHIK